MLDLLYKFLKYTCWYFKYREQFTWPKLKLLDHFLFSLQMAFKILLLFEISCRKQTVFFHSFLCKLFKNFLKTFWYSSLLIIKLRFFAVHFLLKFKTKDLSFPCPYHYYHCLTLQPYFCTEAQKVICWFSCFCSSVFFQLLYQINREQLFLDLVPVSDTF